MQLTCKQNVMQYNLLMSSYTFQVVYRLFTHKQHLPRCSQCSIYYMFTFCFQSVYILFTICLQVALVGCLGNMLCFTVFTCTFMRRLSSSIYLAALSLADFGNLHCLVLIFFKLNHFALL